MAPERRIWQAQITSGFGGESLPTRPFAQRFQPRIAAKQSGTFAIHGVQDATNRTDDFTILPDQWLMLVAGADFETKPSLTAFVRFLLSIASASNGSKKPACLRLSIAWRSREE